MGRKIDLVLTCKQTWARVAVARARSERHRVCKGPQPKPVTSSKTGCSVLPWKPRRWRSKAARTATQLRGRGGLKVVVDSRGRGEREGGSVPFRQRRSLRKRARNVPSLPRSPRLSRSCPRPAHLSPSRRAFELTRYRLLTSLA
jgi:hypothetical protein